MTATTFWGNLATWLHIIGAFSGAAAAASPAGSSLQRYLGIAGVAFVAAGGAANGQGNRQSQTGTPQS